MGNILSVRQPITAHRSIQMQNSMKIGEITKTEQNKKLLSEPWLYSVMSTKREDVAWGQVCLQKLELLHNLILL